MQAFFTRHLETLTRELSLRPAQVQQIQAIFDAARGQAQAMRARRSGRAGRPGPEMRRRHMRARFEVEERVAAVLDREQLLRWLSLRHQHMLEGRGRGPGHGRAGRGGRQARRGR
jgi:Spy/CpxP family protein refolding chaperone